MGDRNLSQFLKYLRSLTTDVPDDFLHTIWYSRLPPDIQAILVSQPKGSFDAAARCADIFEVATQLALASAGPPSDSTALLQGTEDPFLQVAALRAEQDRLHTRFRDPLLSSIDPCSISRDPAPAPGTAAWAADSTPEATPHPPPAATIAAMEPDRKSVLSPALIASRRNQYSRYHQQHMSTLLFIMERLSKRQFLVDTGSDLCVYPRRLIPRRSERVNYDLCAANGTTIHTYRWLPLSLNLGLRRDFTWRFVVADVTYSLIGVHFPSHFGLLMDCRNRLLDGVISLSVLAQAASSLIPSVKTITGSISVDSLVAEFPYLARSAGVQREVRHNTLHHTRTVSGSLVTYRPRRLAPGRLTIAKAEFDAMFLDGTARRSENSWSSALQIVPKDKGWRPLRRLQSTKRPDHLRPLSCPSYP
jgi:hypothetical protein